MDSVRALFYILSMCLFLTTVSCQQSLVSSNSISVGTVFSVYCDADRVVLPSTSITDIRTLTINRMTATDTTEIMMVQFTALIGPNDYPFYFNNPQNRNWNISYTGANQGSNNRQTMKLVWTLNDAKCDDAGLYRCIVDYIITNATGGREESRNSSQNVTAVGATSLFSISVIPSDIDGQYQYTAGENITFSCRVMGPNTLTFRWEALSYNDQGDESRVVMQGVTDPPGPASGTGACVAYSMVSRLYIQIEENSTETYICSVLINNNIVEIGNKTIGTEQVSCQQSLVSSNTISAGTVFSVYCDANRVALPSTSITDIRTLTINRMTATDATETTMVQFRALIGPNDVPYYLNNPQNRNWNISYTGANQSSNNRQTMKLVWTLNDAKCDDAGLYRCIVYFSIRDATGGRDESRNCSQNVTSVAATSLFSLSVTPSHIDGQYTAGENITFTCTVVGPKTLTFQWEALSYNDQGDESRVMLQGVTDPAGPAIGTGACVAYSMVSRLYIQIEENSPETTFICSVLINNNIAEIGNKTIGTGQESVQQPLISPNPISVGKPFTVNCDADHVTLPDSSITAIRVLSIYRKVLTDAIEVKMAEYQALVPPGDDPYYLNNPQNRDWYISYTGANQGVNNRQTMKLVWTLRDAKADDAGTYRCLVTYYRSLTGGGSIDTRNSSENVTVALSGQQPLILPNSVSVGKPFTVYCDADHVNLYDTAITSIRGLSIYRIVETDTTEIKVAEYQALIVSGEDPYYWNIPQGRDWNITFTGANQGSNNRQTMKLVWTVRDTKPDDAGLYRCQVTYYRNTARGGMTDSITRSQIIGICSCEK